MVKEVPAGRREMLAGCFGAEYKFLRQIVLQKGIPFEMKLPRTAPLTYGSLTKEKFDKEIEKGMSDVKAGRVYSADAIEAEMKRDFGI